MCSLHGCPQPCSNTQTLSRGEANGVPLHPTEELRIPPCVARRLPRLQEPTTASGTKLAAP